MSVKHLLRMTFQRPQVKHKGRQQLKGCFNKSISIYKNWYKERQQLSD